ncbi:unnamed protein product [Clonostachys rhizophaga]|uniref:Uncharacterized protein n=1 Tax=Clonostachys rhizophaga TaxID=160324 RepID=A0A9N9YMA5_9HYPO|nr:unnamed protein product [Clonostachys rhizophaga]
MSLTLGAVMRDVHDALAGREYTVIVWGEEALRRLGAPIPPGLDHEIMLVVEPRFMADAGKRLEDAQFRHIPWSFGIDSRVPMHPAAESQIMDEFSSFDERSEHYIFTREHMSRKETIKVALIPATYANISTARDPMDDFDQICGFYWPKPGRLMASFVKTAVNGPVVGCWKRLLVMWAAYWLYRGKMLPETVMDNCDNEMARRYFEACIRPMQFAPCQPPVPGMNGQFVGVHVPPYCLN